MESLFKREYSAMNMHKEIKENYEKGWKESLQLLKKRIYMLYIYKCQNPRNGHTEIKKVSWRLLILFAIDKKVYS